MALCSPLVFGEMKGSRADSESSGVQDIAVRGKVFFSDYYSMGGEKCAAFLETEDGALICILDNMKANTLRDEMRNFPGKVKVEGTLKEDENGKYLKVEDYNIIEKRGQLKGPGSRKKGSSYEYKGSR